MSHDLKADPIPMDGHDPDGSLSSDPAQPSRALLFLALDDVPDRWKSRVQTVALVPLLPDEAAQVLRAGYAEARVHPDDEDLARLLSAGASVERIANELGVTVRSVYRRLARLRTMFEVSSTAELTAALTRMGF